MKRLPRLSLLSLAVARAVHFEGGADAATKAAIDAALKPVQEEAARMKAQNAELLDEKKKTSATLKTLQGQFDGLGGDEGIKSLVEMRKRLENDEVGKLLAQGKHEEWFEQRAAALKKDHLKQVEGLTGNVEKEKTARTALETKLRQTVLKSEVTAAAAKAGIKPEAIVDVQLRAERAFTFDTERDMLVIRDAGGGVVIGKDGKNPKSLGEWLDEQKEDARHWWPESKGGGASGSGGGGGADSKDLSKVPFDQFKAERAKQRASGKRSYI